MRKIIIIAFLFICQLVVAGTGIYESYVIIERNSTEYFDAQASTTNPDFNGSDLGTFLSSETLLLKGGELKSWKDGGSNVTGAFMYYRIYEVGSTPPASFMSVNFPWAEDNVDGNPNNQRWANATQNINILDGLADGDYVIEVYFQTTTTPDGDIFDNNSGANYIANFSVSNNTSVQIGQVNIAPALPTRNETITVTFDAEGTVLEDATEVYFHSGIGTDEPGSTGFEYTVGNWGQNDGVGQMTPTANPNEWQIVLSSLNDYYGIPQNEDAFALNFLFRNSDGSLKEDNAGSNYNVDIEPGNYFLLKDPSYSPFLTEINQSFDIAASANTSTSWTLFETDASGNNLSTLNTQSNSDFAFAYSLTDLNTHYFKLQADFGGEIKYKTFEAKAYTPPVNTSLPAGAEKGVNLNFPSNGEVTFVLHAPTSTTYRYYDPSNCEGTTSVASTAAKEIIYIIGDFNNWEIQEEYKMNVDGDYWWITLNPSTDFPTPVEDEYVYQYFIDGEIKIGDPYGHKISDAEDQFIGSEVYPDLIQYPYGKTSGRATVLELNPTDYQWEVPNFERQYERDDLNVYELHFRDFTPEGTYKAATAKLDYIADMGINTIHVMPVSEFEGNNSWGYNPNYYFAADKAYGTENDLKEFIDEAHKRGIAVVNDIVLNHAFYSNPNAMMYWDNENNRPAPDNPWFNAEHKSVFDQAGHWGADFNHASEHTQQMVDDILAYWITEFKFDGFRFDFTKGFTQTEPDPSDPWASSYDVCRVGILNRMVDQMWAIDNSPIEHYAIFEHLANDDEDKELADYGMLMWSGAGPQDDWVQMAEGTGIRSFWSSVYTTRGFNFPNYMSYMESHDEERVGYKVINFGVNNDGTTDYLSNRLKLVTGFNQLLPGPRMVWQFGELGYDISIDFNGRTGDKPSAWELGYDQDTQRKEIYNYNAHAFNLRNKFDLYQNVDYRNIGSTTDWVRSYSLADNNGTQVIVVGNFDPNKDNAIEPNYGTTGTWYKYNGDPTIDGTPYSVNTLSDEFILYMNDPAYILSNEDIIPPVFNVPSSTIATRYCQFTLDNSYDITTGVWTNGNAPIGQVADNSGSVTLELLEINGEVTASNSLVGFQPKTGSNTILWKATDPYGNEQLFEQEIIIERGDCYRPGVDGVAQPSGVLISTLDRENNQITHKANGHLVLESKNKGFVITKIPLGESTSIISEPVEGMIIYDENDNCLKLYDGNLWGCIKQKSID